MKKTTLTWLLATASFIGLSAQTNTQPSFKQYKFDDKAIISQLSDNGLWAVASGADANDPTQSVGARIINVKTGEVKTLIDQLNVDTIHSNAVNDVTNDGNIAVGELNRKPAYYSAKTGKWTFLQLSIDADMGEVYDVTPDGKYAVGLLNYSDASRLYEETAALWDLRTGKLVQTPGLPTKDMSHEDQKMNRFMGISADGTKVLGCMSYSYLPAGNDLGGVFCYVYDVTNKNYKVIGFTESETDRWTPHVDGLYYVADCKMSNDGNWVTGGAYMVKEQAGSGSPAEYEIPYRYNVSTGKIELYDDGESIEKYGWTIDNQGNVFGAGPAANPYRDFVVRSGKYWIEYAQTIKQKYGMDLLSLLNQTNSGTPVAVSDDGLTMAIIIGPGESYIANMPERFTDIATSTNLLGSYQLFPAQSTAISTLNTVTLTFDRNVKVVGAPQAVTLKEKIGGAEVAKAVGFKAEGKTVTITFRNAALSKANRPYELTIPARTICIDGDQSRVNSEIKVSYRGRTEAPVKMTTASPKDGASVGKFDLTTSPLMLTFDAAVKLTDSNVRGQLYQGDSKEPFAELLLATNDVNVLAYPATVQYLYKDVDYRVEIPAGVLTEVTGNTKTGNEAITLHYKGAYEREISYDDNVIFTTDFSNGVNDMLVLDNDANNPSQESVALGFTDARYGWVPVWDNNSTDRGVASTSMYSPAGKSDDWMVIPQVRIVDQLCKLTFQSQGYKKSAQDRLKVYVWESNNMYNALSSEVVEKIRKEGKLVYNEVQNPGKNEDMLEGDWTDNAISLKEFAGKNVYIAFLNDNENQSAVFIDNVKVLHELPFYVAVTNDETVVNKSEATIKGVIDVRDEKEVFTKLSIVLKNAEGEEVDKIEKSGLSLKKGDKYEFSFNKPLPLEVGEINNYTIVIRLNETENSLSKAVKSLAFKPVKRVVLEEFTGTDCVNCPQGHVVIDNLHTYYGDLFIPMALHCYTGDPYSAGVTDYAAFLNLVAAPSGIVQRSGTISFPMSNVGGDYTPQAPEGSAPNWMALVAAELEKPVEAEVSATAAVDESGKYYAVPVNVKYALNGKDMNHKVFAVVLENGLVSYQKNGFASIEDTDLGEWAKGGKYGMAIVNPFTFDHVVRGWYGNTFTGTADLLPADVKAGETYTTDLRFNVPSQVSNAKNTDIVVMLFDGNTDKLINACMAKVGVSSGIEDTTTGTLDAIQVSAHAGKVTVQSPIDAAVQVISVDGRVVAQGNGNGAISINVPAYRGVALVRIATAEGNLVKKVVL